MRDDETYLAKVIVAATTSTAYLAQRSTGRTSGSSPRLGVVPRCGGAGPASMPERLQAFDPGSASGSCANADRPRYLHYRVREESSMAARFGVGLGRHREGEPGFDFDGKSARSSAAERSRCALAKVLRGENLSLADHEELVQDFGGHVRQVLAFLGIPAEAGKVPPPTLRRQADHLSREWETRYRQR